MPSSTLALRSESQEPEEDVSRATRPAPRRPVPPPRMQQSHSAPRSQHQTQSNSRSTCERPRRGRRQSRDAQHHEPAKQSVPARLHLTNPSSTARLPPPSAFRNNIQLHFSIPADASTQTQRSSPQLNPPQPSNHTHTQSSISHPPFALHPTHHPFPNFPSVTSILTHSLSHSHVHITIHLHIQHISSQYHSGTWNTDYGTPNCLHRTDPPGIPFFSSMLHSCIDRPQVGR
jgi:hypothetical protein